jgi:hypothetical protein
LWDFPPETLLYVLSDGTVRVGLENWIFDVEFANDADDDDDTIEGECGKEKIEKEREGKGI